MSVPCTVFTGFLGSGKTTVILCTVLRGNTDVALIKQLPKGYKVCLLKNEFGDLKGGMRNVTDCSR
jgi:G3E family GTPase